MPAPDAIILIRHAEKPDRAAGIGGVDECGRADEQSLSVRGWQRAGALVPWLAGARSQLGIGVPDRLLAASAAPQHPSRRPVQTLQPLAERLGRAIDASHGSDEVDAAADAVAGHTGTVLVCWRHEPLPALARALAQRLGCAAERIPREWPAGCFDRAWIFSHDASTGWRFGSVPQMLLAGDADAA